MKCDSWKKGSIDSMCKASLLFFIVISLNTQVYSQRYFEFGNRVYQSGENFVAVTSDSAEILVIEAQLTLPESLRDRHIHGILAHGNPGYNLTWHWHFIPNQWRVVETSVEVCDGLPSWIERDTALWTDGWIFCPWSSYLLREVSPNSVMERGEIQLSSLIYPNPTQGTFSVDFLDPLNSQTSITIYNILGQMIYSKSFFAPYHEQMQIDISKLPSGVYYLHVKSGYKILTQKLLKQ
ncbi:MAG: hypothetical protein C0417_11105 [Chlorobiaceae bacterium]|nr:hypothetical protein [Chlorobiaceae bacterium]